MYFIKKSVLNSLSAIGKSLKLTFNMNKIKLHSVDTSLGLHPRDETATLAYKQ